MAEEVAEVKLKGDSSSLVSSMKQAADSTVKTSAAIIGLHKTFGAAGAAAEKFHKQIKGAFIGAGVATAAMAATSLQRFSSFETAMANVSTVADTAQMSLGTMGTQIRKLATSGLPTTMDDLAAAMYDVNSSGFQGAEAFKVLEASARYATAGLTDTATAVQGVAALLNAYNLNASEAAYVTDLMFTAVNYGVITAEEFANSIGTWGAAAASVGVGMDEASAALSTLTLGGEQAERAATSLAAIFRQFVKPSDAMTDALKKLGYQNGQAMIESLGLKGALDQLYMAAGQTSDGFAELIPDTEAYRGAITLVGKQTETYTTLNGKMTDRNVVAGATATALALQMKTLSAQFQLTKNEVSEFRAEVGQAITPVAKLGTNLVTGILGPINDLPGPLKRAVAILSLMGPALMGITLALAALAAKRRVLSMLTTPLKALDLGMQTGKVRDLAVKYVEAGGAASMVRKEMVRLAAASSDVRMAVVKSIASFGLYAAAIALIAGGLLALRNSVSSAKQEIRDLADLDSQTNILKNFSSNMDLLNKAMDDNKKYVTTNPLVAVAKGIGIAFQSINPFDRNTLSEGATKWKEAREALEKEYTATASLVASMTTLQEDFWKSDKQTGLPGGGIDVTEIQKIMAAAEEAGAIDLTKLLEAKQILADISSIPAGDRSPVENKMMDEASGYIRSSAEALTVFQTETATARDKAEALADEADRLDGIMASGGRNAYDFAKAVSTLADSESTAVEKADALNAALEALLSGPLNMASAQAAAGDAFRELIDLLDEGRFSTDVWSEAGSETVGVIESMSQAALGLAKEAYNSGEGVNGAITAVAGFTDSLYQNADALGLTTEQLDWMIALMNLTPETISALVTLPGADPAIAQLQQVLGGLYSVNGFVAEAGVNVTVRMNTALVAEGNMSPRNGGLGAKTIQGSLGPAVSKIQDLVKDTLRGATGPRKGSGGGGGGGGGSAPKTEEEAKWTPTAAQQAAITAAVAKPIENLMTGDAYLASIDESLARAHREAVESALMQGTSRLSGLVLFSAAVEGKDPKDDIKKLAELYIEAAEKMGEGQAQAALAMYSNVEDFQAMIDAYDKMVEEDLKRKEQAQRKEDYLYRRKAISNKDYIAILKTRQAAFAEYTDEWISLQETVLQIEQDIADHEEEIFRNSYKAGVVSLADYREYLKKKLASLEKYSNEWMDVWSELNDLTDNAETKVKDVTEEIGNAIKDVFNSFADPIKTATSLIDAFAQDASVSFGQVEGFYEHMIEGTTRWTKVIGQLTAMGANSTFIRDLVAQGPKSLGFAESILGMGVEGINFINSSMKTIEGITNAAGIDYAGAQVGQAIQTQNNITLSVGDIDLSFAQEGTLTMDDVQNAITTALNQVTSGIVNKTVGSNA